MTTDPEALPSADEDEIIPNDVLPGAQSHLPTARARTWSLVLQAREVPHRLLRRGWGWAIIVPREERPRAEYEIRTYEEKNRHWPPVGKALQTQDHTRETLSLLLLLAIFHNLTLLDPGPLGLHPTQWIEQGAAHAAAIRGGEWWRILTALTLHSGWLHLGGNLAAGALFAARLCAITGLGWGWTLILAAGMSGNLLNALLQSGNHRAVGASTAVFGAIGILCALAVLQRSSALRRRRFLPLAAGAALLAMLGAGGENTDLGAHLFGFVAGLGLGFLLAATRHFQRGMRLPHGAVAGYTALALLLGAWYLALRPLLN